MKSTLWSFWGVKKNVDTESERKLLDLVSQYLSVISEISNLDYNEFVTIDQYVDSAIAAKSNYTFFWNWLRKCGREKIKTMSSLALDMHHEEVADILDYRAFVLEQYKESDLNAEEFLTAIADSISFLSIELAEVAATVSSYAETITDYINDVALCWVSMPQQTSRSPQWGRFFLLNT